MREGEEGVEIFALNQIIVYFSQQLFQPYTDFFHLKNLKPPFCLTIVRMRRCGWWISGTPSWRNEKVGTLSRIFQHHQTILCPQQSNAGD